MNVEIYVYNEVSQKYEKVDLYSDENINMNLKSKDSKDLGKIYSSYSQTFELPATDNNNRILNFFFDSKLLKVKNSSYLSAKIYVLGQLFKSGKLSLTNGKMQKGRLISYSTNFFTGVATLKEIIGDAKLQDPGILNPSSINWSISGVASMMTSTGSNGVIVPLISNKRVLEWFPAGTNATYVNNINFLNAQTQRGLRIDELRPAIPFSRVMNAIISKYNLQINCQLFQRDEYKKLMIYGNSSAVRFDPYALDIANQYESVLNLGTDNPSRWTVTANLTENLHYITKSNPGDYPSATFQVGMMPTSLLSNIDKPIATVTFVDRRPASSTYGMPLYSITKEAISLESIANIINVDWSFNETDFGGITMGSPLIFSVQVEFNTIAKLDFIVYRLAVPDVSNMDFLQISQFTGMEGNVGMLDLSTVPNMKVIDFLSSFFKMFNISVRQDINSDVLFWETPQDIQGQTLDYSEYADIENVKIDTPVKYKKYSFSHAKSKYYSSVAFAKLNVTNPNQQEYGQLLYDTLDPYSKENYEIKTDFSIAYPVSLTGTNVQTFYGFNDSTPTTSTVYSLMYKPNFDEFTLFYNQGLRQILSSGGGAISFSIYDPSTLLGTPISLYHKLGVGLTDTTSSTHALSFKDERNILPTSFNLTNNSYSNYYRQAIERLLYNNTKMYNYTAYLPQSEIMKFDLRNTIIIGNDKYTIEDATINLVTGKTTLLLMNKFPAELANIQISTVPQPTSLNVTGNSIRNDGKILISWSGLVPGSWLYHEIEMQSSWWLNNTNWTGIARSLMGTDTASSLVFDIGLTGPIPSWPGTHYVYIRFRSYDKWGNKSLWTTANTSFTNYP